MATVTRRPFAPQFATVQTQHADIEARFPGGIFANFTALSYSAKNSPEEARGASPLPFGVTRGELKYEASLTIHRTFRWEFRKAATVPGKGVFEGFFPLIVSLSHPDWDRVETDTLYVKVNEWNFTSNAGPAVHMLEIPLYCGYIDFGSQQGIIPQFADIIGSTPGG